MGDHDNPRARGSETLFFSPPPFPQQRQERWRASSSNIPPSLPPQALQTSMRCWERLSVVSRPIFILIRPFILTPTYSWAGSLRQWNQDVPHRAFTEGYRRLRAESQIQQIEDFSQRFCFRRLLHVAILYLTQSIDVAQAVLALKMLGRNPAGSDLITRPSTLSTLISAAEAFKDTPNAASEVLRCIANGLLLVPDSRSTFVTKNVGGGPAVLGMLEVRIDPVRIPIMALNPVARGQLRPTSYL